MTNKAAVRCILVALLVSAPGLAEIAVSVNDAKQFRAGDPPLGSVPDSLSVIDLAGGRARIVGALDVPTGMIGPPASVAMTPDGRLAIATAVQRLGPGAPPELLPADTVSVIDLSRPSAPRLVQTLMAGAGATGVAVNRVATLALIANASADTVSVFRIAGGRLAAAGAVAMPAGSKPVMARFTPDGRSAWVVLQNAHTLMKLTVNGAAVAPAGVEIMPGRGPYSLSIGDKGVGYVTNLGGRIDAAPDPRPPGTLTAFDAATGAILAQVEAGSTPEHVALSPDGRHVAVTLINGTIAQPGSPSYRDHGLLKVFVVDGARITPLAETRTGRWCQGAAWSDDSRRLLLQCAEAKQIEVYRFDRRTLSRDAAATIVMPSRPGSIVTARSR